MKRIKGLTEQRMSDAVAELFNSVQFLPYSQEYAKQIAAKHKVTRIINTLLHRNNYITNISRGKFKFIRPININTPKELLATQYNMCKKIDTKKDCETKKDISFKIFGIDSFTDAQLCDELRLRGYEVSASKIIKL